MSKILILAESGFGKSSSLGAIPELGITGLNVESTYLITVTSKPLPFRGSASKYPIVESGGKLSTGRRVVCNNAKEIAEHLTTLAQVPNITNVVIDDTNYIMQDYYMDNALKKGWDAPKQIGFDMNLMFKAMELYKDPGKNIIMLAHGEKVELKDGRSYYKFKTTGKMVDEYITPAGKFEIVLFGVSKWDNTNKKSIREFLTGEDDTWVGAKTPIGMFDSLYIPNDLGLVVDKVKSYYFD